MKRDLKQIGQIGLGLLGGAIARRLLREGYSILGFDLDPERLKEFAQNRGTVAADLGQVFRERDVVILSLPHSGTISAMFEAYAGNLQAGQIVIDTTTGMPNEMAEIGRYLKARGVDYVEASVAGSSRQMQNGEAILFLGGEESVIARIRPLIDALTDRRFYLGEVGSASRFKLVHNLILGLNRAVLAEGLNFAESLGFDPKAALEILRQTPAASAVMETKGEKMVHRDWQPEAKLSQHLKDVGLILAMAEDAKAQTPLSGLHYDLLEQAEKLGFGDSDNSAILEVFRNGDV